MSAPIVTYNTYIAYRNRTPSNLLKRKLNEIMPRYLGNQISKKIVVLSVLRLAYIHTFMHTYIHTYIHTSQDVYTYLKCNTYIHHLYSLKKRIVSDEEFVKQKQSQLKAKLDSIAQQKAQARALVMAKEVKAAESAKAAAETLVKKAAEVLCLFTSSGILAKQYLLYCIVLCFRKVRS